MQMKNEQEKIDQKWQRVLDTYKRLVINPKSRLLTDNQQEFVDQVNKWCFGCVYMHQPSDYLVKKLYVMSFRLGA